MTKRYSPNHNRFDPLKGADPIVFDDECLWGFSDLEDYSFDQRRVPADLDLGVDIGTRVADRLKEAGLAPKPPHAKVKGMEVGDDRVDASRDATKLAIGHDIQQSVLLMETSESDTFISPFVWNFCEVSSKVPSTSLGSYDVCRKVGDFKNLEYVDTAILRIIIDCSKSDRSHSSTAVGKAAMLGTRLNTPRSEFRQVLHLASFIQDACLRTSMNTDPKYLPRIMGGSGVRALYDDPDNLYLSVKAYRGGGYDRLYGTATRELMSTLAANERGEGAIPILCFKLRDRQDYLHGTYAEKVFIPQGLSSATEETLPTPLYRASGGQNRFSAVENRLVRTRQLLGRRDAEREVEQTSRTRMALFGTYSVKQSQEMRKLDKARARSEFGMALNANAAFQHLLDRKATPADVSKLIKDGMIFVTYGAKEFCKADAAWLNAGGKTETLSIDVLTGSEDMFLRDQVSTEESFRVGGLTLHPIVGSRQALVTTRNRAGLYEISQPMVDWAENISAQLRSKWDGQQPLTFDTVLDIYSRDPEWVQDDSLIIASCLKAVSNLAGLRTVFLISDDRKLGNQVSNTCNVICVRFSARDVVHAYPQIWGVNTEIPYESLICHCPKNGALTKPVGIYYDRGSLAAACAKLSFDGQPGQEFLLVKKELLSTGFLKDGKRFSKEVWYSVPTPSKVGTQVHFPVYRPVKYRHYAPVSDISRPSAISLRSWRSGVVEEFTITPGGSDTSVH